MSDSRIVLDIVLGIALMEAIVKPVTVRLVQYLMRWADFYWKWIPDWLYHPLKKN